MSGWYPKNPNLSQVLQSNASGENPDRAFIAHMNWTALEAVAADIDGIHAAITDLGTGADNTITTAITDPVTPRNITATFDDVSGDGADIKAVSVVITGTDINDDVLTETLPAVTVNTEETVAGAKAFKTVTSILIPAADSPYDVTTAIGWGDLLGLPYARAQIPVVDAYLATTLEGTAATIAASATELASNTITLNSSLNGGIVDAYIVV